MVVIHDHTDTLTVNKQCEGEGIAVAVLAFHRLDTHSIHANIGLKIRAVCIAI